jgi:hypothetical protein
MAQKVAIVSMLRNVRGGVLDSFVSYHLALGFERFFFFFDDPEDPSYYAARAYPNVTAIRGGEKLRRLWAKTKMFALRPEFESFIDSQLVARQMVNVEIANQLAMREGIDWLLHIDLDELFYCPGRTPQQHFQELTDRGVSNVTYLNHEAVAERPDIGDYFREATLFKKNLASPVAPGLRARQNRVIKSIPQFSPNFFLFYDVGKSAARTAANLLPLNAHSFIHLTKENAHRLNPELAPNDEAAPDAGTVMSHDAAVLHYPCCGFEHFWEKYVTLGRFDDKWLGRVEIAPLLPFHIEARDVVMRGDREAAREFYQRRAVISDPATIDSLIECELASRIDGPSQLIKRVGAARDGRPSPPVAPSPRAHAASPSCC